MEAVKQTIAQNMGVGGAHTLVPESQQFDLDQTPDLRGKVAVVTGGSEGIGYGATHTMLKHGIEKIFILSVSKDVVDGAVNAIREEMGEEAAKKVTWLECDISDWKKTKQTADIIAKSTDRIDILINNAARGIMTYQVTDYGVDRHVSIMLSVLYRESYFRSCYANPLFADFQVCSHIEDSFLASHHPSLAIFYSLLSSVKLSLVPP